METEEKIKIKENDVFEFRYNSEQMKKLFEPYHCFDGILIVRKGRGESLVLQDTYWSGYESRSFSYTEAIEKGTLQYLGNLDDFEEKKGDIKCYYDDNDIMVLGMHKGYRRKYYLKKGAVKSKEVMKSHLDKKITEKESQLRNQQAEINTLKSYKEQIEAGNLDKIYLY